MRLKRCCGCPAQTGESGGKVMLNYAESRIVSARISAALSKLWLEARHWDSSTSDTACKRRKEVSGEHPAGMRRHQG